MNRRNHKWFFVSFGLIIGVLAGIMAGMELYKRGNEFRGPLTIGKAEVSSDVAAGREAGEIRDPEPGEVWREPATGMEFIWIPGGCFVREGAEKRKKQSGIEGSGQEVCLDGFWMGKFPVTQGEWKRIINDDPSRFKLGDYYPVDSLSYYDIERFTGELTLKNGGHYRFRLPTEAEWEYACQAGNREPFYFKDLIGADPEAHASSWHKNVYGKTTPVGTFPPNAFGLYDMHGNIGELCEGYIVRGGSWLDELGDIRCASRDKPWPLGESEINRGVRLVRLDSQRSKVSSASPGKPAQLLAEKKEVSFGKEEHSEKPDGATEGSDGRLSGLTATVDKDSLRSESSSMHQDSSIGKEAPETAAASETLKSGESSEGKPLFEIAREESLQPERQQTVAVREEKPIQAKEALAVMPSGESEGEEISEDKPLSEVNGEQDPSLTASDTEETAGTPVAERNEERLPDQGLSASAGVPPRHPETGISPVEPAEERHHPEEIASGEPIAKDPVATEEIKTEKQTEELPEKEHEEKTPPPGVRKHRFFVKAEQKTWMKVILDDGQRVDTVLLQPGDQREWEVNQAVKVILGNAGGIRGQWDGTPLKLFGKPGQVLRFNLPDTKYLE